MVYVVKDVLELNVLHVTKTYKTKQKNQKRFLHTFCFLIYQKYEDLKKSILPA